MADPVDAPVVGVELFEDRAAIVRRTSELSVGRHHLRVGPLTPLVRESGVSFPGTGRAVVEEIRVEREVIARRDADPTEIAALERAWRDARDALSAHDDALRRATEREARADRALDTAREAARRGFVEAETPDDWVRALRDLSAGLRDARAETARLHREREPLERELVNLRDRLEQARAGRPTLRAWLELTVLVRDAGPLQVRYTVPCALWRPSHRATLHTVDRGADADHIDWEVGAVCWNATGEDWTGVQLSCSTARPGDAARPPRLTDDLLTARRRDREVVVEARDETVHLAREGSRRASRTVPGVDDGGEPRTFTAAHPVDLPSDGKPVHVALEAWSAEATVAWQAFPEQSSQVVLRSTQRSEASRPLLAGPVELVRDGEAIGRAEIGLVPPGEPFALGWGSHDGLMLTRRRDHEVDRARITGRQTHAFTVELRLSHLGDAPVRVSLRERVPVSELKEVGVDGPKAQPPLTDRPDEDGRCGWTLELSPGETRRLKLSYQVDAASRVVLPF